jgi:hypothetical protein
MHSGCRYCLTTNIIFGITGQSQCKKCKRSVTIDITKHSSGNCVIDELLPCSIFDDTQQRLIADYMNTYGANFTPFKVYEFIENNISTFLCNAIKWIPYSQIKNLSKIGEGGFSTIYKATWSNDTKNIVIAVKKLHKSQNISKHFLNEVISNIIHYILNVFKIN